MASIAPRHALLPRAPQGRGTAPRSAAALAPGSPIKTRTPVPGSPIKTRRSGGPGAGIGGPGPRPPGDIGVAGYHSLGGGGVRKRRLCVVIIGKDDKMTLMTGRPALRGDARVQMTVRGPSVIYFLASSN